MCTANNFKRACAFSERRYGEHFCVTDEHKRLCVILIHSFQRHHMYFVFAIYLGSKDSWRNPHYDGKLGQPFEMDGRGNQNRSSTKGMKHFAAHLSVKQQCKCSMLCSVQDVSMSQHIVRCFLWIADCKYDNYNWLRRLLQEWYISKWSLWIRKLENYVLQFLAHPGGVVFDRLQALIMLK